MCEHQSQGECPVLDELCALRKFKEHAQFRISKLEASLQRLQMLDDGRLKSSLGSADRSEYYRQYTANSHNYGNETLHSRKSDVQAIAGVPVQGKLRAG
jgi:hypothetical protein